MPFGGIRHSVRKGMGEAALYGSHAQWVGGVAGLTKQAPSINGFQLYHPIERAQIPRTDALSLTAADGDILRHQFMITLFSFSP